MEDIILFVHGYSVTNLNTYGGLPSRIEHEAAARGIKVALQHIFLGRYISFNDELTLDDISRAFDVALQEQLAKTNARKIIAITHSTGGPVIRNWYRLFYANGNSLLTHVVMLAPPNHGSALAQLGKSKLSRIRSWLDGAEPGEKILDWLELGSDQSWRLNLQWIHEGKNLLKHGRCWFFVLTGQDIDRKLYDHVNSYTGEAGSDGVVRVAAANINSRYLLLKQVETELRELEFLVGPDTPFRIVSQKSHSDEEMGIMKSVRPSINDEKSAETIDSVFRCMAVNDPEEYEQVEKQFYSDTILVQKNSRLETERRGPFTKSYIHDRHAMVVFRVRDQENNWLRDFDLVLTGPNNDPDLLPPGFLADRQFNRETGALTYYFNYDVMVGCEAIFDSDGNEIRKKLEGLKELGLFVKTRPEQGMVHYRQAVLPSSADFLSKLLQPNCTTLMEIEVSRFVSKEVFRFEELPEGQIDLDFKGTKPGTGYIGNV